MANFYGTHRNDIIIPSFVSQEVTADPAGTTPSAAADWIDGGAGDDTLHGAAGDDILYGGNADYVFVPYRQAFIPGAGEPIHPRETVPDAVPPTIDRTGDYILGGITSVQSPSMSSLGDGLLRTVTSSGFSDDDGVPMDGYYVLVPGGNDLIQGGDGNDMIFGQSGNDTLVGGSGADELDGGDGNDVIYGDDGSTGAPKPDLLPTIGSIAAKALSTSLAQPPVASSPALSKEALALPNLLMIIKHGDAQSDILRGGSGQDELYGRAGDDILEGGADADLIDGGPGNDTAVYSLSPTGVTVSLQTNFNHRGEAEGDVLRDVENLIGSNFDDILSGDRENNRIRGEDGVDVINGAAGDDVIDGGAGADQIDGGVGSDTASYAKSYAGVTVSLMANVVGKVGHAEGDTLREVEHLQGSKHNDTLIGNTRNNSLFGGDGNDTIKVDLGVNNLQGGDGNDSIDGGIEKDIISGGNGDDVIDGSSGENDISGGDGEDIILGGSDKDYIDGGAGDDIIIGGDGGSSGLRQMLEGGAGNDLIHGGANEDVIFGGTGDDIIVGEGGKDFLIGDEGKDIYVYFDASDSPKAAGTFSVGDHLDFKSGEDKIDLSLVGANTFLSEAFIAGNGAIEVIHVERFGKLQVDINDNGMIDPGDMEITGIDTITDADLL